MKKVLVVFYSRTGTTKKVATEIAKKLEAEIEEILDTVDRKGVKGYLASGRDAGKRHLTKLKASKLNPVEYDLVVIGTPIWCWNISVPVRTYISEKKDQFKKVAFFCTMGGSGDKRAFTEMKEIIGKNPKAVLTLTTKEVMGEKLEGVEDFCERLRA